LLERSNIAVARVVHDDIETPERLHGRLYRFLGRVLVDHVEWRGAHPIAILRDQRLEAARIARRRDEDDSPPSG